MKYLIIPIMFMIGASGLTELAKTDKGAKLVVVIGVLGMIAIATM